MANVMTLITYQVTVHVAGYVIVGRVMSAERSVQLVSQVGEIKYGNSNSGTF